jgi:hypothetical protein
MQDKAMGCGLYNGLFAESESFGYKLLISTIFSFLP